MDSSDKNKSESDFWFELPEALKEAIDEAKAQLDRGEGISHNEVMAKVKERYLK